MIPAFRPPSSRSHGAAVAPYLVIHQNQTSSSPGCALPVGASDPGSARRAARTGLGIALLTLAVLYRGPIWTLIEFARSSDLYSHVLMVPLVSLYLAWDRKREVAGCEIVRRSEAHV